MNHFGFLNCNKPAGMTSRDVVNVVQRRLRPSKVGHAGTLDPLADGVLVLGVGAAVRLVPYVQQTPKRYHASFRLGASSPSGDIEQGVTEAPELPIPTRDQLEHAAQQLTGEIDQTPPAYSAIRIDGRRAYDRVRQGEPVAMPSRRVRVDAFTITAYAFPEVNAEISCGSGTYIRSLGIDLARLCGTVAVMTRLTRVAVGPFRIEESVGVETLHKKPLEPLLNPAVTGVAHLPRITVDDDGARRLAFGQFLPAPTADNMTIPAGAEAAAIDSQGRLRAVVRHHGGHWRPYRVFPSPPF